ncbi:MAG: PAS domain S-box protein [Deltaproteobacteria bacterium]|nr:PAS domain S-box protein [Deltaproteobacteria bacterium]
MKLGIRGKIYCGMISIVLLTGLMIAVPVRIMVERALSQESLNKGMSMALTLAARSQDIILGMDFLYLKEMMDKAIQSSNDVSYSFILNQQGQVLSHTFHNGFPVELRTVNPIPAGQPSSIRFLDTGKELIYDIAVPVLIGDMRLGTVHLGLSKTRISRTINSLLWTMAVLIGCAVLIASLIGAGFADQIIRRVQKLHRASEQVLKGNLDVITAPCPRTACWKLMGCRSEKCPAYGEDRQRCWNVEGTLCPSCRAGEYAEKSDACRNCRFYRDASGDEIQALAESFDAMTRSLKHTIFQLEASKKTIEVSEKKYRRIFESSMDMVFVTDSQGRFLDINQTGKTMLQGGSLTRTANGFSLSDVFSSPFEYADIQQDLIQQGFVKDREFTLKTLAGSELQALLSSSCQIDPAGEVLGCEGIIKDITQRRNMEQQLLQADKLASLGQLSAGVAHEINNPLGLILGYTQLMLREEPESSQKYEDLKTIEKHTRNCKTIVEALLNFARKTETKKVLVDVNCAIEQVITVIRHQFELSGIVVNTRYDPDLPQVLGDTEKLKQVVMNLVMNARQSISKAGKIIVSTRYDSISHKITIAVEDTGSGIPPHVLTRIFDPFFTTKPTGQGTGLGLSVSYGIVKEHGGEIMVDSEPEKGSLFSVTLPAVIQAP